MTITDPRSVASAKPSARSVALGSAVGTDPAKVHDIEHKGRYFSVPGPFLCEPSPQRTPMLFQAGASPRGVRFAAAHAEAVFVSGPAPEIVAKPVKALRAAAAERGRDPRSIKVFTMLTPIVAETRELAVAKLHEYRQFVSEAGALALSTAGLGLIRPVDINPCSGPRLG